METVVIDSLTTQHIILYLKYGLKDLEEYNNRKKQFKTTEIYYDPKAPPELITYDTPIGGEQLSYSYYGGGVVAEHNNTHTRVNTANNNTRTNNNTTSNPNNNNNNNEIEPLPITDTIASYAYIETTTTTTAHINTNNANNVDIHNTAISTNNTTPTETPTTTTRDKDTAPATATTATTVALDPELNKKKKDLKIQFYMNDIKENKHSACFYCTCDFDNPPFYLPKHELNGVVFVYGCFCCPECAMGHVMREHLDDSVRFERISLLNCLYGNNEGVLTNQSIKYASDPYYTLEKFMGNMTIQEYRKLTKSNYLLIMVDKPMSRVLPEIHENYEDLTKVVYKGGGGGGGGSGSSGCGGGSGVSGGETMPAVKQQFQQLKSNIYQVKRQSDVDERVHSKTNIMKNKFGLAITVK